MDEFTPYFIIRSTLPHPRAYGARLTRRDEYQTGRPVTYDTMRLETNVASWRRARSLVLEAFGFDHADKLYPGHLYALQHGSWSEKYPKHGDDLAVSYRQPASDPQLDEWELLTIETVIRVTHKALSFFVAKLDDEAYLIIPARVASQSLRSIAQLTADSSGDESSEDESSEDESPEEGDAEVSLRLRTPPFSTCLS